MLAGLCLGLCTTALVYARDAVVNMQEMPVCLCRNPWGWFRRSLNHLDGNQLIVDGNNPETARWGVKLSGTPQPHDGHG
jgi:hypothetical protein